MDFPHSPPEQLAQPENHVLSTSSRRVATAATARRHTVPYHTERNHHTSIAQKCPTLRQLSFSYMSHHPEQGNYLFLPKECLSRWTPTNHQTFDGVKRAQVWGVVSALIAVQDIAARAGHFTVGIRLQRETAQKRKRQSVSLVCGYNQLTRLRVSRGRDWETQGPSVGRFLNHRTDYNVVSHCGIG